MSESEVPSEEVPADEAQPEEAQTEVESSNGDDSESEVTIDAEFNLPAGESVTIETPEDDDA